MASAVSEIGAKPVLVLGCGNILFGDDGFGPAVIERLQSSGNLPKTVCAINAGTSVREILFDLILSERRPETVIIVDAMDKGRQPGVLFRPSIDDVPVKKMDDFSMHQLPASNLLRELRDLCGVEVVLLVCQVQSIPDSVSPGLSPVVQQAVTHAADSIIAECGGE
jgi:coenzyme F420 hydrogenase subunit delta